MFFSCKTDTYNYDLDAVALVSETGSDTRGSTAFAVQNASYVIHYKQKVLKNIDDELYVTSTSDGFERADGEAKAVPAYFPLRSLSKNYQGFSYSYAVQKDTTVYIYYTRNTVEYSFYKDANTLGDKISGVYGLTCRPPNVLIGQNVVTKWNSNPDGSGNQIPAEFGAVNANYYANGTGIGTKYSPDTAGDIVFTDGTAATTEEVRAATGDQKDTYKTNALAVIIFDHYNAETGDTNNGKKVIGVGMKACSLYEAEANGASYFHYVWRLAYGDISISGYFGYYEWQKLFLIRAGANWDDSWTAMYRATLYIDCLKEKYPSLNISERVKDKWYLPCWRELGLTFAKDYKFYQILKNACSAIDLSFFNADGLEFWANTLKAESALAAYSAYIKTGNNWAALKYDDNDGQWKKTEDTGGGGYCYTLPYREFK